MALLVRFREGPQAPEETFVFPSAPVRIGRNPLNDLALDYGFVSQWHGVIKFDRSDIAYVDLGSTNGTQLDGLRVQERTPVRVVGPGSKLSIGRLEFRLEWTDGVEGGVAPRPKIKTQFVTSLPASALGGGPGTAAFGSGFGSGVPPTPPVAPPASSSLAGAYPPPVAPDTEARARDATEQSPALDAPLVAVHEMKTYYEAYRQSWTRCLSALRHKIESSPPAMREMTAFFMASEFPAGHPRAGVRIHAERNGDRPNDGRLL